MAGTGVNGQCDTVGWVFHLLQSLAGMPRLAARLFPGRCAQARGSGLGWSIGRGRLTPVSTGCVEPLLQVGDLRGQRLHLFLQRQGACQVNCVTELWARLLALDLLRTWRIG